MAIRCKHGYGPSNCLNVWAFNYQLIDGQLLKKGSTLLHEIVRVIQINHQPDAKIFQFIILTFIYNSTCFGRCPAHHQELNDCSGSLWFYLRW
jgi:hypothetical protein